MLPCMYVDSVIAFICTQCTQATRTRTSNRRTEETWLTVYRLHDRLS